MTETILQLGVAGTTSQVGAGECVFRQGEPARHIYYLVSGQVRLIRYQDDGSMVVTHTAHHGETFAEASLFSAYYHCEASADTDATVVSLPCAALLAAIRSRPDVGLDLIRILSVQVRDLRLRLEMRNLHSAPDRVYEYLRWRMDASTHLFSLDQPLKMLAQELGMAHETMYRALALLEREGRIRRIARTILVQ